MLIWYLRIPVLLVVNWESSATLLSENTTWAQRWLSGRHLKATGEGTCCSLAAWSKARQALSKPEGKRSAEIRENRRELLAAHSKLSSLWGGGSWAQPTLPTLPNQLPSRWAWARPVSKPSAWLHFLCLIAWICRFVPIGQQLPAVLWERIATL